MEEINGVPNCINEDPELFFPHGEDQRNPNVHQVMAIKEAKAICALCDVRVGCLEKALEDDKIVGIWGGMTTHERRVIIRRGNKRAS